MKATAIPQRNYNKAIGNWIKPGADSERLLDARTFFAKVKQITQRRDVESKAQKLAPGKGSWMRRIDKANQFHWRQLKNHVINFGLHTDMWVKKPLSEREIEDMPLHLFGQWIAQYPHILKKIQEECHSPNLLSKYLTAPYPDARFSPCSRSILYAGWDALLVEPGAILYHGTSIHFRQDSRPRVPLYLTPRLGVASLYGWADKRKHSPEYGKVVIFCVRRPHLLWVPTVRNLKRLRPLLPHDARHLMDGAFVQRPSMTSFYADELDVPLHRHSITANDKEFMEAWCRVPELSPFDGLGYKSIPGFHEEYIFCVYDKVVRHPIEYRVTRSAPRCVFEIIDRTGHVLDCHPATKFPTFRYPSRDENESQVFAQPPSVRDDIRDPFHDALDRSFALASANKKYMRMIEEGPGYQTCCELHDRLADNEVGI